MPPLAATAGPAADPAAWIHGLARTDPARRRGRTWLLLALLAFVAVQAYVPFGIGASWRECDTQAIARNFLLDGFNPLRPRIDWRGDTDGAVECEFPLYQTMIASVMAVIGEAEWPGRLISLVAMVMATLALHRLLEARAGPAGALAGALVFMTGGHAFLLSTRVMPDALSTAMALAGVAAFTQFLATGRQRTLVLATAMTTLACLCKPTALQVGLWQFLWAACLAPQRLRELRVWLAFATVLAVCGAWIVHGANLHAETGLTFGVASGGETKFPTWRGLRTPMVWWNLFESTLRRGFGPLGFIGLAVMLWQRRFDRADFVVLLVVGLGLVGTLRYSYHWGVGPHYHVFAAVAGAYCVARAFASPPRLLWLHWLLWLLFAAAVLTQAGLHVHHERGFRQRCLAASTMAIGADIAALSEPSELAVVHGPRERVDPFWRRRTNFEEPTLLYHARRRGWVLPLDGFVPEALVDLKQRGARIVVDAQPASTPPEARAWLVANADLVSNERGSEIYRLRLQP